MIFSQPELPSSRIVYPAAERTLLSRRLIRVRYAWFVLGTLFGAAVGYTVFAIAHHDEQMSQRAAHARALALATMGPTLASANTKAAAPAPQPQKIALPAHLTVTVGRGETLASILSHTGVSSGETSEVIGSLKRAYNPRALTAGHKLELDLAASRDNPDAAIVSRLAVPANALKSVVLTRRADDSFQVREVQEQEFKGLARAGGEIHSSLYQTGMDAGIPPQMLSEIISAFSYDVDFQRDIHEGDRIDVVFERWHTGKNVTTGYGKILYASLTLGDDVYTVYRHVSSDGYAGYYNPRGESVKKALLKTPINGAHITSGFGWRMHPLLGYSKMHKGIDFGAATGTPIYAAGDGVIEEAGRKGGYGNYVRVKHNATYETAYGHASRIARGIRPGAHVHQGEVIAYVGSTGMSTGPHLHYEILVKGVQVNPSGVKFRTGQMLTGRELATFHREIRHVQTALDTLPQNRQLASLDALR